MELGKPSLLDIAFAARHKPISQVPTYYKIYQNNGLSLNLINQTLQIYFINNKNNPMLNGQHSNINVH